MTDDRRPRELGINPRALGTNPRALGTNPRALGTNPRALGTNPRALGTNTGRCKHLLVIERRCADCQQHISYNPAKTIHNYERGATAVYRLTDDQGRLLYVGLTNNPELRFSQHASDKYWWPQVSQIETIVYPSRVEAELAEDWAIFEEQPLYNKMRNIDQHAERIYRRRGRQ